MGIAVQVPEPVYERITDEAEAKDVARGVVVRDWMQKARQYDAIDGGDSKWAGDH